MASDLKLTLYIAGQSLRSQRALADYRLLCLRLGRPERDSEGEVIDILEQPDRANEGEIVAIPTLVRVAPLPRTHFVGDLSDLERVIAELGIGTTAERGNGRATAADTAADKGD